MELEGRSAIVTGGAGGLGAATVRRLVDVGMRVAIFDRDADRAAELAKELGDSAAAVGGDVNDDEDVAAAIDTAASLGRCRCSSTWQEARPAAAGSSAATASPTTRPSSPAPWT
jgi:NAD(P)-dependent dehydrogenase (short-subunit alcohol dehydrogenase family)